MTYYNLDGTEASIKLLNGHQIDSIVKSLVTFGLTPVPELNDIVTQLAQDIYESPSEYAEPLTGEFEATKTGEGLMAQWDNVDLLDDEDFQEIVYHVATFIGWW